MGGDGTNCQVLTSAVVQQQGINSTELKPLNITFGAIPTGWFFYLLLVSVDRIQSTLTLSGKY